MRDIDIFLIGMVLLLAISLPLCIYLEVRNWQPRKFNNKILIQILREGHWIHSSTLNCYFSDPPLYAISPYNISYSWCGDNKQITLSKKNHRKLYRYIVRKVKKEGG